jgi:uncharacterized protein
MSDELLQMSALMRALFESIRDPAPNPRVRSEPQAYFESLGLAPAHAQALSRLPEKRLLLYRKLVRRGLSAAVRAQLSGTANRLGALFESYMERFCDEALPSSPYLRDVAFEFAAWARPLWLADSRVPAYLLELAHFELWYFELSTHSEAFQMPTQIAPDLERPLAFQPGTRLCLYEYAVHTLSEDSLEIPEHLPTALLGHRDSAHDVHFLELSPLAAAIAQRLLNHNTLAQAVREACQSLGFPVDASILEETAELLSDWSEKGIVLGGT